MSWETALDRQIHDYLPDLKWAADEPMAKHTSFRICLLYTSPSPRDA